MQQGRLPPPCASSLDHWHTFVWLGLIVKLRLPGADKCDLSVNMGKLVKADDVGVHMYQLSLPWVSCWALQGYIGRSKGVADMAVSFRFEPVSVDRVGVRALHVGGSC